MRLLFLATLAVWGLLELRQSLNRRPGAQTGDQGSLVLVRLAGVAAWLLAAFVVRLGVGAFPVTPALSAAILALMWAGIALRQWCFMALGRYFTFQVMTSPDQRVITAGPYRLLRHPSYAAILLILVGVGLSYGNVLSLAALVGVPAAGLIYRIRVEEAALERALGPEYTDFTRSRKRLVPFVW